MELNPFNDEENKQPVAEAPLAPQAPGKRASANEAAENASRRKRWLAGGAAIVLVFLAGFLPMWAQAGRNADERDAARRDVKRLQLEIAAASAALDARRGEYEPARQSVSWFFTTLQAELDSGDHSSMSVAQRDLLKPLLEQRDALITLLARNDPASAGRLAAVYLACRQSLRGG
jgi:hypothetical protein